jgi:hypothetical protein
VKARCTALLLLAAVVVAGCGGGGSRGTTASVTTSAATGTTTIQTAPARTAADDLVAYFDAAQSMDRQLAVTAVLINGGIRANTMKFDQATLNAIAAIQPAMLGAKIPAGLPPELERRVLLVQSELVSRRAAFNYVTREATDHPFVVRCLAQGAPAAARFTGDLAAARSLAAETQPITIAAPNSRAAADLAVTLQYIKGANTCCGSCGGVILTQLPRISWASTQGRDGTITVTLPSTTLTDAIPFTAHYLPGTGWSIQLQAG